MVTLPLDAPISTAVASPPKLIVVAVVSRRLNVVCEVVISSPSTFKSPPRSVLPVASTLKLPLSLPITKVVAELAKLTLVAVVLSRLNVVELVVKSPPSTFKSRSISTAPPTFKSVANPTPPVTVSAPVVGDDDAVVSLTLIATLSA